MTPAERARIIIEYLADNEVAGTPAMIEDQLELFYDADISVDTVRRRLKDFAAVGYVKHLPEYSQYGYYTITRSGRFRANQGMTDEELEDIIGARNRD
jgi:Fe2+ or Zn2+ uptake regulation protein